MEIIDAHILIIILKIAFAAFFSILFIQSGLDKVFDFQGNLSWLNGHFSKTPFKNSVQLLLIAITITELLAGLLSAAGIIAFLLADLSQLLILGNIIAIASLLFLFLGQRIAKDYAGAAGLVPYLLMALIGLIIQGSLI